MAEQAALDAAYRLGHDIWKSLSSPTRTPPSRSALRVDPADGAEDQLQIEPAHELREGRPHISRSCIQTDGPSIAWLLPITECRASTRLNDPAASQKADACRQFASTHRTAFDYFLLGEDWRRRRYRQMKPSTAALQDSSDRSRRIKRRSTSISNALELDPRCTGHISSSAAVTCRSEKHPKRSKNWATCVALRPNAPWSYSARGMASVHGPLRRRARPTSITRCNSTPRSCLPSSTGVRALACKMTSDSRHRRFHQHSRRRRRTAASIEAAFYRAQIYVQQGDLDQALDDLN